MTSKDFIREVAEVSGETQKHTKEMAVVFEETLKKVLERGESVKFADVTFSVKETEARTGRNPATGEAVEIPAGKKVVAKLSGPFKKLLK